LKLSEVVFVAKSETTEEKKQNGNQNQRLEPINQFKTTELSSGKKIAKQGRVSDPGISAPLRVLQTVRGTHRRGSNEL
jgi:hypothetical protein